MKETKIINPDQLVEKLIDLDNQYASFMQKARSNLYSAFETRWEYGRAISENSDYITKKFGSQKELAKAVNTTEAIISNNKRAYENLQEWGCESFSDVKNLLNQKQIKPTVRNFEKIGTLLNEPDQNTEQKEQIPKDRKRLEELMEEVQDIINRNEPANDPEINKDATELLEDLEDIKDYLQSFEPEKTKFKSEKYLDFVRHFGRDLITMEPAERCDPHHAHPDGGTGSTGETLPDYYAIPVSRKTHTLIHLDVIKLNKEEILTAQFKVMSAFINKVL